MITEMPPDSRVLSSNDFTPVQSVEVKHKKWYFLGHSVPSGVYIEGSCKADSCQRREIN